MFGPKVAPNVKPMQINESAVLMYDYLMNNDLSRQHKILRRYVFSLNAVGVEGSKSRMVRRYTASLMFYLGYGRRVTSLEDPLCVAHDMVEECECSLASP
jgi:hypothetical protein